MKIIIFFVGHTTIVVQKEMGRGEKWFVKGGKDGGFKFGIFKMIVSMSLGDFLFISNLKCAS